jgi:hypothetical protein
MCALSAAGGASDRRDELDELRAHQVALAAIRRGRTLYTADAAAGYQDLADQLCPPGIAGREVDLGALIVARRGP